MIDSLAHSPLPVGDGGWVIVVWLQGVALEVAAVTGLSGGTLLPQGPLQAPELGMR